MGFKSPAIALAAITTVVPSMALAAPLLSFESTLTVLYEDRPVTLLLMVDGDWRLLCDATVTKETRICQIDGDAWFKGPGQYSFQVRLDKVEPRPSDELLVDVAGVDETEIRLTVDYRCGDSCRPSLRALRLVRAPDRVEIRGPTSLPSDPLGKGHAMSSSLGFSLVNNGAAHIPFYGEPDSLIAYLYRWDGSQWQRHRRAGLCGTGPGFLRLEPGERVRITDGHFVRRIGEGRYRYEVRLETADDWDREKRVTTVPVLVKEFTIEGVGDPTHSAPADSRHEQGSRRRP